MDAACFQHYSPYAKYKDRLNRKQSDIALKNKALKIAADHRFNGYQRALASMVFKFFNEKTKGSGINLQANSLNNEVLTEELHKPIIKNFKRRKVYSTFKDSIWGVDLAAMQLISKYNKGIRHLLFVIDLFSRYAWVIPLKNKKGDLKRYWKILTENQIKYG